MKRKIIAVDFDETLFTDEYPNIGNPIWKTINYCKDEQLSGATIILWTCRNGNELYDAIKACSNVGLFFDYINKNTKENMLKYGANEGRKICADIYIDDRAKNIKDLIG